MNLHAGMIKLKFGKIVILNSYNLTIMSSHTGSRNHGSKWAQSATAIVNVYIMHVEKN